MDTIGQRELELGVGVGSDGDGTGSRVVEIGIEHPHSTSVERMQSR